MGFFDFLRKLKGTDEDSRIKSLNRRISELQFQKTSLDKKLEKLKSSPTPNLSWYHISHPNKDFNKFKPYSPREMKPVRTMQDLFEKRKRDEEERIRKIKDNALKFFDSIRKFIDQEDVKSAEDLLFNIAPIIEDIKDKTFQNNFDSCKSDIEALKEAIIKREIERIERETREKAEKEERERIENERRAELARQEQIEKERRAKEYEERLSREEQARALEIARLTAEVTRKKENAQAFINHLRAHGVSCFYHFTSDSNIQSIRKLGGLYSWYYCRQNDIEIPDAGGDSQSRRLDMQQGLADYVRLSFCDDHPMQYRKQQEGSQLVLLKINLEVATFIDTQFSNVNAAASNNRHGPFLDDLRLVNIYATQRHYVSRNDEIFAEHQAECMVKTFIPIKYITNINNPYRL